MHSSISVAARRRTEIGPDPVVDALESERMIRGHPLVAAEPSSPPLRDVPRWAAIHAAGMDVAREHVLLRPSFGVVGLHVAAAAVRFGTSSPEQRIGRETRKDGGNNHCDQGQIET